MSIEHNDATELSDETGDLDHLDSDLDGSEDAENLVDMAAENDATDAGTTATESTQDLIDDGADPALQLDDDTRQEKRLDGVVPLDEEMAFDDLTRQDTIEDRIAQEEPDPNSSIVPDDAGRRY